MDKYGIRTRTLKYCVGTPTDILPFRIPFILWVNRTKKVKSTVNDTAEVAGISSFEVIDLPSILSKNFFSSCLAVLGGLARGGVAVFLGHARRVAVFLGLRRFICIWDCSLFSLGFIPSRSVRRVFLPVYYDVRKYRQKRALLQYYR
jgi:hypothetical protein